MYMTLEDRVCDSQGDLECVCLEFREPVGCRKKRASTSGDSSLKGLKGTGQAPKWGRQRGGFRLLEGQHACLSGKLGLL